MSGFKILLTSLLVSTFALNTIPSHAFSPLENDSDDYYEIVNEVGLMTKFIQIRRQCVCLQHCPIIIRLVKCQYADIHTAQ